MATINVKDADDNTVAIEKPLVPGRALAVDSRPVVFSTEDKAAIDLLAAVLGEVTADPAANTVLDRLKAIASGITSISGYSDGLEALATTLNGLVDGLETLVTSSNTKLDTINTSIATTLVGFVDGLETLIGTSNTSLTTLQGYVDGLEGLITTLNAKDFATQTTLAALLAKVIAAPSTEAKQDTIIGHVDGIEGAFTTLNAKDFATQTTLAAILAKIIAAPATAANQATIIGHVDGLEALLTTQAGYLDGIEALLAAAIPAGTNNIGDVDVLSVIPGVAATSLGKAEDAIHATGDVGVMVLGVRQDTQVDFGADGDYVCLSIDANGAVRVTGGGGGTEYTEDAAAVADPAGQMLIAVRRDTLSVSEVSADGDNIALKATNKGQLHVERVGGSTEAKQDTIVTLLTTTNTYLDGVETLLAAPAVLAAGSAIVGKFGIDQTTPGTTNGVQVLISALPAGAATAANQTTIIGHVDGIEALLTTQAGYLDGLEALLTTQAGYLDGIEGKQDSQTTSLQLIDDAIIADDAAFTPATSKVMMAGLQADETAIDSVDEGDAGAARMTLDRKAIVTEQPHIAGGLSMSKTVSAASTNATSVKASAGKVYSIQLSNVNAEERYLKLYNKASAPTVGTDTPVKTLIIPGSAQGGGSNIVFPTGIEFTTGIAFALTTEATDAGTTGVAASEIVVNIDYK